MRISDWSSDVCSSDLFHDQDRGAKVKASELICDPIHPPMAPQHRQAEQRQSRTAISAPGKAFGTPGNVRQNVAAIFRSPRCQDKRNSRPVQTLACNYQLDPTDNTDPYTKMARW